jgi:geranylgeranyl reductase family protein
MDTCDVLIVGGGPAGSSCAWMLRHSGLDVAILDRQRFPRDKVCGGWITPAVLEELEVDPVEYARERVFQPITGFRTSYMGGRELETRYRKPVSYGIRRYEFDAYLLRRSGARLFAGTPLTQLERSGGEWIVNHQIRTPMLIGAGGTFCPVARYLGAKTSREIIVAAQEAEFPMDERQAAGCSIRGEVPELYFCPDMRGYGWCFRKNNFLNVGLGRMDTHGLSGHVAAFLEFLKASGKLSFDLPHAFPGHAYLLYGMTNRQVTGDGVLLIGDAGGVAYAQSGEGIRPAVESGLLAAKVLMAAKGRYCREALDPYKSLLANRFGKPGGQWATAVGRRLPSSLVSSLARRLLETHWFTRQVILNNWFLHNNLPALDAQAA